MKLFIPALISISLLLGACSQGPRLVITTVPFNQSPALKSCAPAPRPPSGTYTQKDVAKYVAYLKAAHLDCKENLAALNAEIDSFNAVLKNKKKPAK
jgi:hypothetical protein